MSILYTGARFWVEIGHKLQSLGKISQFWQLTPSSFRSIPTLNTQIYGRSKRASQFLKFSKRQHHQTCRDVINGFNKHNSSIMQNNAFFTQNIRCVHHGLICSYSLFWNSSIIPISGFRSGELGGHSSLPMNPLQLVAIQSCATRAGAPSCWKTKSIGEESCSLQPVSVAKDQLST